MLKYLRNLALSKNLTLEERRFILVGSTFCIAIVLILLDAIATQPRLSYYLAFIGVFLSVAGVVAFTLKTKRLKLGAGIIIVLLNLVILPVGYFRSGGLFSGAPVWLVAGILLVFVLSRGTPFWIYLGLTLASFALTVYLGVIHPEWIVPIDASEIGLHMDFYLAIVKVSGVCGLLFLFQSMVLTDEVNRAEEQAKEIEQLNRTQNSFFSSMSHEIRTPITTITGLNEIIMREKDLPAEILENTVSIQTASKALLSLINDLLDMSRIQSGKMEIVPAEYDIGRMISEITDFHLPQASEKKLNFEVQVMEGIPPVLRGDANRVKQVITNLVSNAIKYTDTGSVILRFGGDRDAGGDFLLRVEVEDSGIGIRREDIPYLFDPFRRVGGDATRSIEGTGLGLSIAKQLVDMMGGSLSVDSIYTVGSTFIVQLPQKVAKASAAPSGREAPSSEQQYEQRFEAPKAAVLIVDDNRMNRMVCQKLLKYTKVQVDMAQSGAECLKMTHQKHYDVILMDHEMPQLDGIETLRQIRQQQGGFCRETPVVALTANAGAGWEDFYLRQGFSAYLSKPIQSAFLESVLLSCLPPDMVERRYVMAEKAEAQLFEAVNKRPFVVTTDSLSDIPEELIREHGIRVMPYYIQTKQGRFKDSEEIDTYNLQQYLSATTDNTAHSFPASVADYEAFFGDALAESKLVVHISASARVSSAYDNAREAARSFNNVHVVDSGQISLGQAMVAVRASELLLNGKSADEMLRALEEYAKRLRSIYLIPELHPSNTRIKLPALSRILTSVFNLEPVFVMRKGRLVVHTFMAGYLQSTKDQFVRYALRKSRKINTKRLCVGFAGCPVDDQVHVLEEIKRYVRFDEVIAQQASASNYINCGPNTIGFTYEEEGNEGQ